MDKTLEGGGPDTRTSCLNMCRRGGRREGEGASHPALVVELLHADARIAADDARRVEQEALPLSCSCMLHASYSTLLRHSGRARRLRGAAAAGTAARRAAPPQPAAPGRALLRPLQLVLPALGFRPARTAGTLAQIRLYGNSARRCTIWHAKILKKSKRMEEMHNKINRELDEPEEHLPE